VAVLTNKLSHTTDRRKIAERRAREQKRPYNLRMRPDRRLNNISVEWIPFSEIAMRPTIRESLSNHRSTNQATLTHINFQSVVNIFKNKFNASGDLRKGGDRRIYEQKPPYDRRVRPDRRLNNILVEWIPY
jgi:hypothetical protein